MTDKGKILIVDSDTTTVQSLKQSVKKFGFNCISTSNCLEMIDLVSKERPDIIFTDFTIHGDNGFSLLEEVKDLDPNILIIILAANGTIESAIGTMKAGAFDYIQKPFSVKQVENSLEKAITHKRRNGGVLINNPVGEPHNFDGMIAESEVMQDIFWKVLKISNSKANVLIYGDSGTGKELLARSVHNRSRLSSEAFIPVDCVALPENLLESELFGYEKGAFTGAESMRRGLLEYADGGTLFLDEICELAPNLQAKLLRVLQEREFRRVGGKSLIKVDLRIIAATNKNPADAVKNNFLREDLYYRLNVIPLELPPLKSRKEDISLLVHHYLDHFGKSSKTGKKNIGDEVINVLMNYLWPGNIRELRNLIECMVSLTDSAEITLSDLPEHISGTLKQNHVKYSELHELPFMTAKNQVIKDFEKEYFKNLLGNCAGNISKGAQLAAVSRRTIYRMISTYDLHKLL